MNSSGAAAAWRPPFTASQWQELEHQALIFKYLMAGIPVPPDLLLPIRKGFDSMASRFFHHPSMGYCSYGKKLDPEPGRCRRTDGKKWRCSKDAYPDSKYCERHMHRGRNRSRKPVEAQTLAQSPSSSSSPSSTVTSLAPSGSLASGGSSGGGFRSCLPLHSIAAGAAASGGGNAAAAVAPVSFAGPSLNQLQMDLGCHGIGIGDHRYGRGGRSDVDERSLLSEASGSAKGLGVDSDLDASWHALTYNQGSSYPPSKQPRNSAPPAPPLQELGHGTFRPVPPPPAQSWGCFDYVEPVKQDNQNFRAFFDEWPKARDTWTDLEDDRGRAFPATQLSISIPMASSDFSTASSRSPNDERESLGP